MRNREDSLAARERFEVSLDSLKILILSTPKTGNTWLKHVLSAAYRLPMADLDVRFSSDEVNALGPRWVAHQHYPPSGPLLDWIAEKNVVVLTSVRHPGDVLVSLYHYVRSYAGRPGIDFGPSQELLLNDDGTMGENIEIYVRQYFFMVLHLSIAWLSSGVSRRVSFEDLSSDPVGTLIAITDRVVPISLDCAERSVEQSRIDLLRRLHSENRTFYRRGEAGVWQAELPLRIVDVMRTQSPYPAQMFALGYHFDPVDPVVGPSPAPRLVNNPFKGVEYFDNGMPIPAAAVRAFLSFDSEEANRRWPEPLKAGPGSFLKWLKTQDEKDPCPGQLLITNLMSFLHDTDARLMIDFPDVYGTDRVAWLTWWVHHAIKQFDLHPAFVDPVLQSLKNWSNQPAEEHCPPGMPTITNLPLHIHRTRPDLQHAFSDPFGKDRVRYLFWMFVQGIQEYRLEVEIEPFRDMFLEWANERDLKDTDSSVFPLISRFAAFFYSERPDLQTLFPDLYGRDRLRYLTLFLSEHEGQPALLQSTLESWAKSCRDTGRSTRSLVQTPGFSGSSGEDACREQDRP